MITIISFLFTIVVNFAIGVAVLSRAPKEKNNQKFALLSFVLVGWIGTLFIYYAVKSPVAILFFGRLNFFFAAFIPLAMFEFVLTFPRQVIHFPKWLRKAITVYSLLLAICSLTMLIDAREVVKNAQYITTYGPVYLIFLLSLVVVSSISMGILIKKLQKSQGVVRFQLQYLLLGFISLVSIAIFFNGILPYFFHVTSLDPFGPLATVAFLGFISYAMIRHRFMDINRIAAGTGVHMSAITVLGAIYFTIALMIGKVFFPQVVNIPYIITTVLFIVAFKYIISPIRKYFWQLTNKFFYNNIYDREELFNTISQVVVSTLYLDVLLEKTLQTLREKFMIHHTAFVTIEENMVKQVYVNSLKKHKISFREKEAHAFGTIAEITQLNEIENKGIQKLFHKKDIQLVIPISLGKKRKGFFCLGEKASGAAYSEYDIQTFELILPTISIALQNAISIEKIKRFNTSLKKEVDKATRDLRRANDRLRVADTLKDEFISIASHELKTPTTAIQGFLWLVLRKDRKLSQYSKEKLEKVATLTHHMTTLVNDMLDVSKIESKRISLRPEPFDIGQLVEEIKGELDIFAIQKNISIQVKNGKPFPVVADRQRMHQVVSNLMNNSLKYTLEGGKIFVTFHRKKSKVEVSIADTGIGIKEKDFPKLFTKFGKLDDGNSVSSHLPGSGLGLYITKNFVELSGGDINVESTYGKGSTFTFSLPMSQ